jgi:uncharacterized cupredoxin-like copper-binding protein
MTIRSTTAKIALVPLSVLGALAFAGSTPAGASTKTTTVTAVETDFHIALSKSSFSAGKYTFVAKNKGQTTHALMITGPGIKMAMTPDINPGKSAKLTVTLKKGKYDVYCPIPGHKALGMNVNLTVGSTSKSSSTGGSTSTSSSSGGYGY